MPLRATRSSPPPPERQHWWQHLPENDRSRNLFSVPSRLGDAQLHSHNKTRATCPVENTLDQSCPLRIILQSQSSDPLADSLSWSKTWGFSDPSAACCFALRLALGGARICPPCVSPTSRLACSSVPRPCESRASLSYGNRRVLFDPGSRPLDHSWFNLGKYTFPCPGGGARTSSLQHSLHPISLPLSFPLGH